MSLAAGEIRTLMSMARRAEDIRRSVNSHVAMCRPALDAAAAINRSIGIAQASSRLAAPSPIAEWVAATKPDLGVAASLRAGLDAAAAVSCSALFADAAARLAAPSPIIAWLAATKPDLGVNASLRPALNPVAAMKSSIGLTLALTDVMLGADLSGFAVNGHGLHVSHSPELLERHQDVAGSEREVERGWLRDPYVAVLVILVLALYAPSSVLAKIADAAAIYAVCLEIANRRGK